MIDDGMCSKGSGKRAPKIARHKAEKFIDRLRRVLGSATPKMKRGLLKDIDFLCGLARHRFEDHPGAARPGTARRGETRYFVEFTLSIRLARLFAGINGRYPSPERIAAELPELAALLDRADSVSLRCGFGHRGDTKGLRAEELVVFITPTPDELKSGMANSYVFEAATF
jgi:hypothetical protein